MIEYRIDDGLKKLADKVISKEKAIKHLQDEKCRIIYQYSSEEKKAYNKTVYADTEKIKEKYKAVMPYDFIVTFYEPNCANLSEDKMERLMYHELRHVGFEGEGKYRIIPHEIEDFRDIVDNWGIDWIK